MTKLEKYEKLVNDIKWRTDSVDLLTQKISLYKMYQKNKDVWSCNDLVLKFNDHDILKLKITDNLLNDVIKLLEKRLKIHKTKLVTLNRRLK